jgi:hypothetical protein
LPGSHFHCGLEPQEHINKERKGPVRGKN